MTTYKVSARKLGRNCDFQAEAPTKEEAVRKAAEHAKSCNSCAGLSEESIAANVEAID